MVPGHPSCRRPAGPVETHRHRTCHRSRPASATTTQSPASTAILIAVDLAAVSEAISRNRCAAQIGFSVPKDRADKVQAKHHALARRLITREADYLRFTTNPQIPPDNDSAEREIQMIKVRQKVSDCLRTFTGSDRFTALRSYVKASKLRRHRPKTRDQILPRPHHTRRGPPPGGRSPADRADQVRRQSLAQQSPGCRSRALSPAAPMTAMRCEVACLRQGRVFDGEFRRSDRTSYMRRPAI